MTPSRATMAMQKNVKPHCRRCNTALFAWLCNRRSRRLDHWYRFRVEQCANHRASRNLGLYIRLCAHYYSLSSPGIWLYRQRQNRAGCRRCVDYGDGNRRQQHNDVDPWCNGCPHQFSFLLDQPDIRARHCRRFRISAQSMANPAWKGTCVSASLSSLICHAKKRMLTWQACCLAMR